MSRQVSNTSAREVRPEWLMGGNPSAIEQQESEGQRQLVASAQLPAAGLTPELAAQHNIEIVGPSGGDQLFVDVRLPAGMVKRATEHPMWSELVNENGVKVASIFYKAAFYDRKAFVRFD